LEAPSFTRPLEYEGLKVPSVYTSGNHKKIKAFKEQLSQCKSLYYRPS
jgi:tRNA (guanine37-N1)-methyltransferase